MKDKIKIIAFDADDTLWVNEPYYRNSEKLFCDLMEPYIDEKTCMDVLYTTEVNNLELYGFGAKSFILSMIETAISISKNKIGADEIDKIIELGKKQINIDIELLDGVEETLQTLSKHYRLILATKGDLLDQERKLEKSKLAGYFHHIEVMSDKNPQSYKKLLHHLDIEAKHFLMIGNSLKSDIMPVLEIGGHAIHIPYHTTWIHEHIEKKIDNPRFMEVARMAKLKDLL